MYDVVIVGAGPAGLSAALYAARAGKKTLLLENKIIGGQITQTETIANYPGSIEDESGFAIAERMKVQAKDFGAEIRQTDVKGLILSGETKRIETAEDVVESKSLILAMGTEPRKLGLDNEDQYVGKGLGYCATCDGAFYSGLPVYVVGGGDAAFDEGLYLSNIVEKVYILYRGDKPRAAQSLQDRAAKKDNIEVILNTNVTELGGDKLLQKMTIENSKTGEKKEITGDFGLFIFIGQIPMSKAVEGQVDLERGYVVADESTETSVEGVYVAGDLRTKTLRQVVTAVSDGAVAGIAASKYVDEKF